MHDARTEAQAQQRTRRAQGSVPVRPRSLDALKREVVSLAAHPPPRHWFHDDSRFAPRKNPATGADWRVDRSAFGLHVGMERCVTVRGACFKVERCREVVMCTYGRV